MTTRFAALEELPRTLAARDFGRLERCFHPDARLRALTPGRVREAASSAAVAALFADWFGNANVLRLVDSRVDSVHGRSRLCYRMSGVKDGRAFAVEQTAYCDVIEDTVSVMDLVCSGFRFYDSAYGGLPYVHEFDAGDLGCASGLTGEIRRRLAAISVGDQLRVVTRDPAAREDIPAFARLLGQRVLAADRTDDTTIITMERIR